MVDIIDIFKSLYTNIGTVIKNPEMLKFVLDHLKTKKMCKHAVKKLPYLLRHVPDRYKTQQMCDKAVNYSLAALKFIPDWFFTSKMIKYFLMLCKEMKIYSTLTKSLVMSYFLVMKWVFLI